METATPDYPPQAVPPPYTQQISDGTSADRAKETSQVVTTYEVPDTPGSELKQSREDESDRQTDINVVLDREVARKRWYHPIVLLAHLVRSRFPVRLLGLVISTVTFILIIIPIASFLKAQRDGVIKDVIDLNPVKLFAGIGVLNICLSIIVTGACLKYKKARQLSDLSNAIFTIMGVVGFSTWMAGCLHMSKMSKGNVAGELWYVACAV